MSRFRDMSALFGGGAEPEQPVIESTPDNGEKIVIIPPEEILPHPRHTYRMGTEEEMRELTESVAEHGVLEPVIIRINDDGNYEMVGGHRRQKAAIDAGLSGIPCIIRHYDDDTADIIM